MTLMNPFRSYRYWLVDVFTTQALEGNQLAVFPNASGIDDVTMQKIAKEMNLAETTFVLSASRTDCAACVRIFTTTQEMVFAGHPTVGTSFVLLEEGIVAKNREHFVLEERVGPVPVRVESGECPMIWLTTPPIQFGMCYDRSVCAEVLGLDLNDLLDVTPQLLSAGNPTVLIGLRNRDAVDRAWIDLRGVKILRGTNPESICVFVFTPTPQGAYSRMFAPGHGVVEDPATGSSTGPLAAFMMRHKLVSSAPGTMFVSEQGTKMGRRSLLYVKIHGDLGADGIEVGGHVTPVAKGDMSLRMD